MPSVFNMKAIGLNRMPNQLEAPEGSLSVAQNVNIYRDGVVEPRRGFKIYGDSFGVAADRAKQLLSYKLRILRHYGSILQYDNGSGTFANFNGSVTETDIGLRIKHVEQNGNLYFTSSDGIKKISAQTAADFTSVSNLVTNAGAVKAVDITGLVDYVYGDQTGFLTQDSAVAYRVVWGYKDRNTNLILGTPSQRIEVYNYLQNLLIQDFMHMLGALDNIGQSGSMIDNKNYVNTLKLGIGASSTELYNNLVALTKKIDNNLVFADNYDNLGTWDASTNTPSIHNHSATVNDTYIVTVSGTQNLGNGSILYNVNDILTFDGLNWVVNSKYTYKGLFDANYVYRGNWDAFGNNPTLVDGTGTLYDFYIVTVAGTKNLGSGSQTFAINDTIYYDGTKWLKSVTPIVHLADGTGSANDLYRIVSSAVHNFGSGGISFVGNDFVSYNGSNWVKDKSIVYVNDWNATTNVPNIYPTTIKNGDFYVVSVPGTQDLGAGSIVFALNDRVVFSNGLWTINNSTIVSGSPLEIDTAVIANGVCTITFKSGNPSLYMLIADSITLSGFNITGVTNGVNGTQIVSSVSTTSLTFNTTISGAIVLDKAAQIVSHKFQSIPLPTTPDTPTTDAQLVTMQKYITNIITALVSELPAIISAPLSTQYIATLDVTKSSTVTLDITVPQDITSEYFFQIYRSSVFVATDTQVLSTDVFPNDELQIVYEAFPTPAEIAAGTIMVEDIVPDSFRGANLYTNASTGEGILQANDVPPFARDISVFKNSTFYANTHTRHRLIVSLLGVGNMITDFNNSIIPSLTIASTSGYNTYTFVSGKFEITHVLCGAGSTLAASGTGSYFDIHSGNNIHSYRVWFKIGTTVAPADGGHTLVSVLANSSDSDVTIAEKLRDALNLIPGDFSATNVTDVVTVTCQVQGKTTDAVDGTTGFVISVTQQGDGEDAAQKQILLSNNISPAIAVQETAQSMARVINKNPSEIIYVYYTSGAQEVPGQMIFEARTLTNDQFSVLANNTNTGASFNPPFSPTLNISSITTGSPTTMTVVTSAPHGLVNLDYIYISGSNSTPSIDGYQQITFINSTSFRVNKTITVAGTSGGIIPSTAVQASANEKAPNRLYYSKFQQPEAVPVLNYFELGAKDKAILRIYPLRDSLFVFKEDGLYRISGNSIPFVDALFDASCILIAPDSVSSINNVIYGWTRQGISSVTESGTRNISRPIDVDLLPLASSTYSNFTSSTWGVGYESDRSYYVFTLQKTTDTHAKRGYKYNILTNTWTTIEKEYQCGVVNFYDDQLYVGVSDSNNIEQERKTFTRADFADREYDRTILPNSTGVRLIADSISNIAANDVLVQNQYVTIYLFNSLLKKLDFDSGTANNYFSTLFAIPGDNMRTKLVSLAQKLDSDGLSQTNYATSIADITGSITSISTGPLVSITSVGHGLVSGRKIIISSTNSTPSIDGQYIVTVTDADHFTISPGFTVTSLGSSGAFETLVQDFVDLQVCYNEIITKLNIDLKVAFSNYVPIVDITSQEVLITNSNIVGSIITIAQNIPFIQGSFTVYKAIPCQIQYSPNTFGGDPVSLKHIREAQVLFDSLAFTEATISFATDLLPMFEDVAFTGDGNGAFGFTAFGEGFFGGASNGVPIRTYIPRDSQRCRYMLVRFSHGVAREKWALYGITLTGETQLSARAYR